MPFNSVIDRASGQPLVPEKISYELLKNLEYNSAAMKFFKKIPMSTSQTRMPVLSALPTAYFVNGDTGLKQTTSAAWDNKYLNVEELAVIVPIPEAVLDDTEYDIWGTVQPLLEQALGRALDAAIFFGINEPASWPAAIVPAAVAKGFSVLRGSSSVAEGGVAEDINKVMAFVENSGFAVNGHATQTTFRSVLRGARDSYGQKLLDVSTDEVDGIKVAYTMAGLWPTDGNGGAELISGDWTQGILGTRKDITYKLLTESVIQDNTGAIIYNLAQQDMVALRVVMRVAFQVANTINYLQEVEANRYPFAVLNYLN